MCAKIKNRHRLKQKEMKKILDELQKTFSCTFFSLQSSVEIGVIDGFKILLVDNEVDFFFVDNERLFFSMKGLNKYTPEEHGIIVDMGAVKFVTNGADIMAAGIVKADPHIEPNDQVWICDETHHKPLAVGIALCTGEEMTTSAKGKAVRNIHYVGDKLWTLSQRA